MKTYTAEDLRKRYEAVAVCATASITFTTPIVGGLPAGQEGVEAYVKHHLKLDGEAAEAAVRRILREETIEEEGSEKELEEKVYGSVNQIRRSVFGPWLGSWMVKACLKTAASRLGLYAKKKGTKGDMVEMGEVRSTGRSLRRLEAIGEIYLVDAKGNPVETTYEVLKGKVNTPSGSMSIVNTVEVAPVGSMLHLEYRMYDGKLTDDEVADIFACAQVVGLGSAKAFDRGKFTINKLEIERAGKAEKE